jgi:group I intron endonuclease
MGNIKIFRFGLDLDNYKKSGIYIIKNTINNKFYIGSTINFSERFNRHYNELLRNIHGNCHLQNSWNFYGKDSFVFEIVEVSELHELLEREQYYLDTLKPHVRKIGYNICKRANSRLGVKENPEITRKRKLIQKEVMSRPEVIEKIKKTNKTWETKTKRSIASIGRKWNESSKKSFSEKKKKLLKESGGYSQETKNKMSIAKRGKIPSNIKEVSQYTLDGLKIRDFKSIADAVSILKEIGIKISSSKISLCISGKRNKAGGFIWKDN